MEEKECKGCGCMMINEDPPFNYTEEEWKKKECCLFCEIGRCKTTGNS